MPEEKDSLLGRLANPVANEVGRQLKAAGLPTSLENAIARQLANSGVSPNATEPSPFGPLVLVAYEASGGQDLQVATPAAAAVQLLIVAGDVLDDIQDGDPIASLDVQDPARQSELVVSLLALSHAAIVSIVSPVIPPERVLAASQALSKLQLAALAGQHRDVERDANQERDRESAEAIIAAKSGSLGRAAAETGARLATPDEGVIRQIGDFGQEWAILAQVLNDIAAVWPGGTTGTDIARGRLTLPIALGLEHAPADPDRGVILKDLLVRAMTDSAAEQTVRRHLQESGAIQKAWAYAAVHHTRAASLARAIQARNPQSKLHILLKI